jgi:hypothetical protein
VAVVFPRLDAHAQLRAYVRQATHLRLFANDLVPDRETTASAFVEPADSGYAALGLTAGAWRIESMGSAVQAVYPEITFTFAGLGETIVGCFVTAADGRLLWSEHFGKDGAFRATRRGDQLVVNLAIDQQ